MKFKDLTNGQHILDQLAIMCEGVSTIDTDEFYEGFEKSDLSSLVVSIQTIILNLEKEILILEEREQEYAFMSDEKHGIERALVIIKNNLYNALEEAIDIRLHYD